MKIEQPDGEVIEYTYNALGLRDSKTTSEGTVHYIYERNYLIAETDADGNVLVYYTRDSHGNLVSMTRNDKTYDYHFNIRGDVLFLTDEGETAASYRYVGRYGYYYDGETGNYLLRRRYYDPVAKRFLTKDEWRGNASRPLTMNRYLYCGNDPVNYIDPSGMILQRAWNGLKDTGKSCCKYCNQCL